MNTMVDVVYGIMVQASRKVNISRGQSAGIPQSNVYLAAGYYAGDPLLCVRASAGCLWVLCGRLAPACARGSKYAGDGNQFLSVVELPEGAIVEWELGIAKKPMNMC